MQYKKKRFIDRNHHLYRLMLKRKYMYIKISYKEKKILSNKENKTIIYNYSLLLPEYIYTYYPNVRLVSRVIPTMPSVRRFNKVISRFYSKGPKNSRQYLPNLANKYLLYGNFEWNKP